METCNDPACSLTHDGSNCHVVDLLPDLSQELAEMGRGSLQRRILRLEQELKEAHDRIHDLNGQVQEYRLKEQLAVRNR